MASKVIVRLGTHSQLESMVIPLDVGEIGYETDVRAGVIGDGSTTPPEFMTTKSNGDFDFSSTDTIKFNKITANNYNGVNLSQINAANGIIVRTGNGTFSSRTLTSNDNSIQISNSDGVQGNPVLTVNPNLDLSAGTTGLVIPQGTIAQRPANPEVGTLRYCVGSGLPYSIPEIYSVDGSWRSIREYVYNADYTLAVNANAPTGTTLTYSTIQQALLRHLLVDCSGKSIVSIPEGVFTIPNAINIASAGKQWSIQGVTPATANLTSIAGVTGTNGLWTVVVNLDDVSHVNIGNYIVIDSLRGYTTQPHRGFIATTAGTPTITQSINLTGLADTTSFLYEIKVGDNIETLSDQNTTGVVQYYMGKVVAVPNAGTIQMNTNIPFSVGGGVIYSSFTATGTCYSNSNSPTNIIGIGTLFTSELNVNDIIKLNGETKQIISITSDTSLIVANTPANWPTTPGNAGSILVNNNPELHQGAFKVVAVDAVNKKVTILNNCLHQPPVNKIGTGSVRIIKSVVSFTNPVDDGFKVTNNANLDLQNLMIISGSGTGTQGISATGSRVTVQDIYISGFYGSGAAGITLNQGASCLALNQSATTHVSSCYFAIIASVGSTFYSAGQVLINSCNYGVYIQQVSQILAVATNAGMFKSSLSIIDCSQSNFASITASYGYLNMLHVAYNTSNNAAINIFDNASLLTLYGTVVHDCSCAAINVTNDCFVNVPYLSVKNLNTIHGYAVIGNFGCSVNFTNSILSNVYSIAFIGSNSTIYCPNSLFYDTVTTMINASTSCCVYCACSYLFSTNSSVAANGNSVINVFSDSYGCFDNCYIYSPSSTVVAAQTNGGSFASIYNATLVGSTLLSPPKNTVGNANAYIAG